MRILLPIMIFGSNTIGIFFSTFFTTSTFSNMIPTLPPPRVDAKNEVYVHIYQLFVSLCNHPSITIVDIILTNLAQLFAEISFKHALQYVASYAVLS